MEQQNSASNPLAGIHKTKLYALIVAAIGIISCILPWWSVRIGYGYGNYSVNGLRDLGILAFIGFIGAGIVTFVMGDKTKEYMGQEKMIAAGAFAVAGAVALIQLLRQSRGASFGIFIAIAAGVIGALLVWGIVKAPAKK